MSNRIFRPLLAFAAAILSSILLTLAFPMYDLGWLGWVAIVPLLISILNLNALSSFFLALIFGVVSFSGIFSWIFDVPGYKFMHHVLLGLYFGPLMGLFGLIINVISRRWNASAALFAVPFIWVSIEYLRSNLSFLALPWALLGHTQYQFSLIIQIASYTGAYGISFLLAAANAALTAAILSYLPSDRFSGLHSVSLVSRRAAISMLMAVAIGLGLTLAYGLVIHSQPINGPTIRTSVLQGNIDHKMKSDPPKYAAFIMKKYSDLSRKAARDKPELIVWPEAATPGFVLKNLALLKQIVSLIRETQSYFLIGSSEYPKFMKNKPLNPEEVGNTALFFSPAGKVLGQYLKIHLVPFGEYLPYKDLISWPEMVVPPDKKTFEISGKDFKIFQLGDIKFGTVICWEVVFPQLIRKFVNEGAEFIINLTNEGWFGDTAAPHQMVAIVIFRAVENRVPVARAANTGISCFIDSYGKITGRVEDQNSDDTFVEGYLTGEIRPSHQKTFYTLHGDIFVYIVLALTGLILVFSVVRIKT